MYFSNKMQAGVRDVEVHDVVKEIEKGFTVSDDDELDLLHSWYKRMKELVREYDQQFEVSCTDCF